LSQVGAAPRPVPSGPPRFSGGQGDAGQDFYFRFPHLSLPTLAAYTPRGVTVEIVDEKYHTLPDGKGYDLVGITAMTPWLRGRMPSRTAFAARGSGDHGRLSPHGPAGRGPSARGQHLHRRSGNPLALHRGRRLGRAAENPVSLRKFPVPREYAASTAGPPPDSSGEAIRAHQPVFPADDPRLSLPLLVLRGDERPWAENFGTDPCRRSKPRSNRWGFAAWIAGRNGTASTTSSSSPMTTSWDAGAMPRTSCGWWPRSI